MKLYKGTIYFYGLNGIDDLQEMKKLIKQCRYDVYSELFDIKEAEIGNWHDGISINKQNASKEDYEELFDKEKQLEKLEEKRKSIKSKLHEIECEISDLKYYK